MTTAALFRARATDPVTSHIAAERACQFAGTHAERIHAALTKHGPMCAHVLESRTGLTVVQIDRRICELVRAGKAYDTELTSRTPTGGWAIVWAAR